MSPLPAIFSLLIAAAGWFYVLHASRAKHLTMFENNRDNKLRIRLRQVCGGTIMTLAVLFYVAYLLAERKASPAGLAVCLLLIVAGLPVILFLAWVDLRLTRKMRESFKQRKQ